MLSAEKSTGLHGPYRQQVTKHSPVSYGLGNICSKQPQPRTPALYYAKSAGEVWHTSNVLDQQCSRPAMAVDFVEKLAPKVNHSYQMSQDPHLYWYFSPDPS